MSGTVIIGVTFALLVSVMCMCARIVIQSNEYNRKLDEEQKKTSVKKDS